MGASRSLLAVLPLLLVAAVSGQSPAPNVSGGVLHPEQAAYDVQHYDLALRVDPEAKAIEGALTVRVRAISRLESLLLDLDPALEVRGADEAGSPREVARDGGRFRVKLGGPVEPGGECEVRVRYGGNPKVAANPPWDGGFTWAETKDGRPWIATSCQGEGADLWWPCKDHPSDEPAGMTLAITVPASLVVASNGRHQRTETSGREKTWHWKTSAPINNYAVAIAIAPYEILKSEFRSRGGETCPVVFYALPEHAAKARKLLPEIVDHLRWFEETFGPYPFRGEKYGVAETPFLGMEHQTLIAYGYGYQKDQWGYDWLHHHELAHEWWGNLVTCPDWNDFWIHEGIGTWCQALYVEKLRGEKAMRAELAGYRRLLANRRAVAPRESVDSKTAYFGAGGTAHDNDIYFKGACVLHTLRWLIGKEKLLSALQRFCYPDDAARKSTDGSACRFGTTDDLRRLCEEEAGRDLGWFFDVYLRQPKLPKLVHEVTQGSLSLRWEVPEGAPFPMPVEVEAGGRRQRVEVPASGAVVPVPGGTAKIDPDHHVLRALR